MTLQQHAEDCVREQVVPQGGQPPGWHQMGCTAVLLPWAPRVYASNRINLSGHCRQWAVSNVSGVLQEISKFIEQLFLKVFVLFLFFFFFHITLVMYSLITDFFVC